MRKPKLLSVQELPVETANTGAESCVLDCVVPAAAVSLITYDRMFQPCEMDSDLMRSAGLELNVEECKTIESPSHTIQCQCITTGTHDSHARAVRGIPRQWLIDLSGV